MADTNGAKAFSVSATLDGTLLAGQSLLVGVYMGRDLVPVGSPVTVTPAMLPYSVSETIPAATGKVDPDSNRPMIQIAPQGAVANGNSVDFPAYSLVGSVTCEEKIKGGTKRGVDTSVFESSTEYNTPGDTVSISAAAYHGAPALIRVIQITSLQDA